MKFRLALCFILFATLAASAQRQGKITSLKDVDSLATLEYQSYETRRVELQKAYQKTADTTQQAAYIKEFDAITAECDDQLVAIYTKYLKIPGIVERLYALRTRIPKAKLEKLFAKLPKETQKIDPYALSLRTHIDTRQVEVGDTVGDFRSKMVRDGDFRFSEFTTYKDVLLIFGGLDCMGPDMLTVLKIMYSKVDLSKLEIVSVFLDRDKKHFEDEVIAKGVNWVSICDFKGDHSLLKITFGVQATPTCFYIKKGGEVAAASVGVSDEILELIKVNSRK